MNAPATAPSTEPTTDAASLVALTIRYADTHYARENWLAASDFLRLARLQLILTKSRYPESAPDWFTRHRVRTPCAAAAQPARCESVSLPHR